MMRLGRPTTHGRVHWALLRSGVLGQQSHNKGDLNYVPADPAEIQQHQATKGNSGSWFMDRGTPVLAPALAVGRPYPRGHAAVIGRQHSVGPPERAAEMGHI